MFNTLFTNPAIIVRHTEAPYCEERERYLRHCEGRGYTLLTLLRIARELLRIARRLKICPEDGVITAQIEAAANDLNSREHFCAQNPETHSSRVRFIQLARSWLRFRGYWREPTHPVPFQSHLEEFRSWMQDERGFTPATIDRRCGFVTQFLRWLGPHRSQFSAVRLSDVDAFLADYGSKGNCRVTVSSMAYALRAFFNYSASRGWCSTSIAHEIHGPRIFSQEQLPFGPSWPDVRRLIASMETEQPRDIRNLALVMLVAIYGFRASEVATLIFEDIDWEQNLISVSRGKRRGRQTYPLIPLVGNAIIRYLREVRPQSPCREIFLSLVPPYRPITPYSLYSMISTRMKELGIQVPHLGPHSLRHACASHLLAEGFSLKEIGDHLGHRCTAATRIYAKVDMYGLREVATFDTGGLL